ncbi:similar to Saccharomyces cerevisiae YLR393W ATP10 Mitochondrial inner membrane protein required for assembly of the F0 sector of mitochondrial F1F0 ATP synthase [Maudiozyma saulgeensis]|uniref:Similar to Saccharomyces cerevisiae YLR393W ATP10 Mitochondrial inner membrane protein required for assembly of the F0 sector of mitochondrial F1F0 ATP synthase n=1 Tax=Maudiozyma saulgeensis TaxID=1789683 RepID=A0A1X7RAK2_9SACH|nr:similar to Saccharomyces cerevisiae YLR393W ATP10 Mitochondrial inner membrane protein required for assembly of the F0 sector of mitochondrial F1F0 ATP synthase [Kazachstania saulgeensis]
MLGTRQFSTSSKQLFFFQKFFQPVIDASKPKPHVVTQLVKPVGLNKSPANDTKYSRGNSFKDLFDQQKTKQRTDELTLEMSKSGMYDLFTFRKTNGKLFLAPKSYWRKDKALYFPHMTGKPLSKTAKTGPIEDNLKGKTSIVRIFGSETGNQLSNEFIESLNKHDPNILDGIQLVNINWMENAAKTMIVKLSMWSMRSKIPETLQKNYFICDREQLPFTVREQLMINNLYTGYILLVDSDLKIRWIASGGVTEDELQTLLKSLNGVRNELDPKITT